MGLSLFELNLLTLDDFVSFIEMWTDDPASGTRRATQADIDRLLG